MLVQIILQDLQP